MGAGNKTKELSQNVKVLRQLFLPRTRQTRIKRVENFWIF